MKIWTIVLSVVVMMVLFVTVGCESGFSFTTSQRVFYSDNNALTGKPLGDPGGRSAGMAGGAGTAPSNGFPTWTGGEQ